MAAPRGYGLEIFVENSEALYSEYKCPLCQFVLREAVQTECGHQFCSECLRQALAESDQLPCSACGEESDHTLLNEVARNPDFACRRVLKKMLVVCENRAVGCPWNGKLCDLDNHLGQCEYAEAKCEKCHLLVSKSSMGGHLESGCPGSERLCPFGCSDVGPDTDFNSHNEQCFIRHKSLMLNELQRVNNTAGRVGLLQLSVFSQSSAGRAREALDSLSSAVTSVDRSIRDVTMAADEEAVSALYQSVSDNVKHVSDLLTDLTEEAETVLQNQ